MTTIYRINWARVQVCNGYNCWKERRCMAEREVRVFGIHLFWWPVGEWREYESLSVRDIERDVDMRKPLPKPRIIE